MPMVYADEDVAAAVMGYGDFSQPYAEVMGVGIRWTQKPRGLAWGRKRAPGQLRKPAVTRAAIQAKIARTQARLANLGPSQAHLRPRLEAKLTRLQARLQATLSGGYGYTAPSPQVGGVGATFLTKIFEAVGLKDPLSKYKEKGMSLAQIFARFNASVDRYQVQMRQIPRGSVQSNLQKAMDGILRQRARLAPAFAPGSTPGKKDEEELANYVSMVKSFRTTLAGGVKAYGLRMLIDDPEAAVAAAPSAPAVAKAQQFGGGWLWLIPLAVIGILSSKGQKRRR